MISALLSNMGIYIYFYYHHHSYNRGRFIGYNTSNNTKNSNIFLLQVRKGLTFCHKGSHFLDGVDSPNKMPVMWDFNFSVSRKPLVAVL